MSKGQGRTLLQVWLDLGLIELSLEFVRRQNHNHVSSRNRCGNITGFEAIGLSLGDGRGTRAQTNRYINTGLFQVARVSVAL